MQSRSMHDRVGSWASARAGISPMLAAAGLAALYAASLAFIVGSEAAAAPVGQAEDAVWVAPDGSPLPFQDDEEIIEFMRSASIESVDSLDVGVTDPRQVILEQDGIRMRAVLRDYEETFERQRFAGVFYMRLRDSYVFDVPAYRLSRLLGLNNVPPVTFRRLGADRVTLQAWLEGAMMETERIDRGISPPSAARHRQQMQDTRVFDTLIGNVDRNTGNILVDADGNFWLIDHSRAFAADNDTRYLERIEGCSRWLYERLRTLTYEDLLPLLSPPLSESKVRRVLERRDLIAARLESLIEAKGEGAVLFEGSRTPW